MYLSVQLSYYPLNDDYKPPIKDVIARLEASGLEVHANRMSTQVFGDYDTVMAVLADTMKWSFQTFGKAVFVANFLEGDRRPRS
ncbi:MULTISPECIES: YkoF family thiamine/hydroxymethylpyrimidine-binding protein [Marinobacter]|uniref:YkoF family thiamine/hydroxymethylpyrimidine-binding protein n=1 Tax=Marinobacter xestospongiae TaxID=994319 RepID=A0ABU3VX66_9GAMM|nr:MULTISPECIES: YkoF family thiamine/hydroxymethylpyrimidine-binding protein [Marinobacter]MCG8517370.1 thiamine-binding protein [Pseudomonadales bacterium]MDV2078870.1 YkoF family thiamine/hydroxymethylpyrimidine-binding protein [Marinobacter xestospongiae]UDL04732.1 thiamine-binding protein [Marinobacter sp. CA1]